MRKLSLGFLFLLTFLKGSHSAPVSQSSCTFIPQSKTCSLQLHQRWLIHKGSYFYSLNRNFNFTIEQEKDEYFALFKATALATDKNDTITSQTMLAGKYCLRYKLTTSSISTQMDVLITSTSGEKVITSISRPGRNWTMHAKPFSSSTDFKMIFRPNANGTVTHSGHHIPPRVVIGLDDVQTYKITTDSECVISASTTSTTIETTSEKTTTHKTTQKPTTTSTTHKTTSTSTTHKPTTTPKLTTTSTTTLKLSTTSTTHTPTTTPKPSTTSTTPKPTTTTHKLITKYIQTQNQTTAKTPTLTTPEQSTNKIKINTDNALQLEDAIHPGCSTLGWNISVDMELLRKLYPQTIFNNIYFGDNTCRGFEEGNMLLFKQGFKDCLTSERISNGVFIYDNNLFYAIYDPNNPFIIRQYKWKYSMECDVSRNEVTSSHVHHDIEAHHSAISSHYNISMAFFKDYNFIDKLPGNPIHVNVGGEVYVKVFTTVPDWSMKMRLHTCFTKPNDESTDSTKYYVIKDGCEMDSNTHIISQSTHETRFVFQDFVYATYNEGLNIYCNVTFCEAKDYSPGCTQSCTSKETQTLIKK